VKTTVHYPEHYGVRNPQAAWQPDTSPEKSAEEKRAELRAIADAAERATRILEEQPRRRAR
jgi:hypothetical protein